MDEREREIRKFIYDRFRDTSHPPLAQHIVDRFGIPRPGVVAALRSLQEERQLTLIPGTDRIFMAHPFSALITPFHARLRSGREYFINCSFDTLALHVMLGGAAMTVSSFCHRTGTQIEMYLEDGAVRCRQPEATIIYLGLPAARWWENIIDTCGNQFLFFAAEEEARAWVAESGIAETGRTVSIEKTLEIVVPVYGRKMDLDYERPTADEMNRHFACIGLTGSFWEY
jgi:hypothetical protein